MALKVEVVDRVSTYPGRVTLTPVTGQTNTYTMERADVPVTEGTPINKVLFDSKADTLTEDATLYVSNSGNDVTGRGSSDSPFKTIQKAIDSAPKHLGGHTVLIDIVDGTYTERVVIEGFSAGHLILGRANRSVTLTGGIDIINSSFVETNVSKIVKASNSTAHLLIVQDNSSVLIGNNMTMDGSGANLTGIVADRISFVATKDNTILTINNCANTISAQWCSHVTVSTITGKGNIFGMAASQGSIISYFTDTTEKAWSNLADSGGLVLTGNNSSDLSGATIEL